MKGSNIFVHIELDKLLRELGSGTSVLKDVLKSQAGYFNIITSKYFSDSLASEWDAISGEVKSKGPKIDSNGSIVANAVVNTIEQMSDHQWNLLVGSIASLHQKVKKQFE